MNFDLPPGQLAGIVGENGASRSTDFDWETYLRFCLSQNLRNCICSALVVSHLAYDASRLDRMYCLHDGSVGGSGLAVLATGSRPGTGPCSVPCDERPAERCSRHDSPTG
ncbi:hypothetical protein ACFYXC_33750 [Streptomyces sp. NPDC002701]|uniref:hypothetical protein n=1 Tax=Streptomyces sp. NPDC002701 TaxID=3364661 RepID=UPI0036B084CF